MVEVVERLTQKEIDQNTTWKVVAGGIQQPNNPARLLPLGTFLTNGQTHTPSDTVADAVAELKRLRALAESHGNGHWSGLPDSILPNTWTMRLQKSRRRPSITFNPIEDSSVRTKKSKEREDNSEGTDGEDDTSGPSSAVNDDKIRDQKATLMTSSFVEDANRRNLDEGNHASNLAVQAVFNNVTTMAADVAKTFKDVQTDFQEAEAGVESDNTNITRLTHLPPANILSQPQLHLPPSTEQTSTQTTALSVGAVAVNEREVQSSNLTRTKHLPKTLHNTPRIPKQVFDTQAEGSAAKMAHNTMNIPEGFFPKEPEELPKEFPDPFQSDTEALLKYKTEQLAKELHKQEGFQDGFPDNFESNLRERHAEQIKQLRADRLQLAAKHKELDERASQLMRPPGLLRLTPRMQPALSKAMSAPHTATAAPLASTPAQVTAAPHTMGAADSASAYAQASDKVETRADGTVDSSKTSHQSHHLRRVKETTEYDMYFLDDFSDDELPYGWGAEWNNGRNKVSESASKPIAGPQTEANTNAAQGKKQSRVEFQLDFSPEPAAWELLGSENPRNHAAISTAKATADFQTEASTAQYNADQGKKRSRGEFQLDLSPEPAAWEMEGRKTIRTYAATPTKETLQEADAAQAARYVQLAQAKEEEAKRRKAFDEEYNCIPDMRLDSEKRKKSRYVSFAAYCDWFLSNSDSPGL